MTKSEVEQLIQAAITPLQQEITALKAKLETLSPTPQAQPALLEPQAAQLETTPPVLEPETSSEIPPERSDFQRFLQRGLEQEQVRYSEEAVADKPEAKKGGWNPFRR